MQINPRSISRLVRLGTKAFRSFQSSQKRNQGSQPDQQRPAGSPGPEQGGQAPRGTGDGAGSGG